MTDDERKLMLELCGQLSMAVTICRMDTGPFRPDASIKSWEASVKRGMAQAAQDSGDDRDPAIPPRYIGEDELFTEWYRCPQCKGEDITRAHNYCPNCGVKLTWPKEKKNGK